MMLFAFGVLIWSSVVLIAACIALIGCALENLNNELLSHLGTCMIQTAEIVVFGCIIFIFVFLIVILMFILFSVLGGLTI